MDKQSEQSAQGAIMTGGIVQADSRAAAGEEALYFNRELSWLTFNQRVLDEAQNEDYPLLERLRFLSISGSNLDEFMTVRVAGLAGQARAQIDEVSIDGRTPSQQLVSIREAYLALEASQQQIWRTAQAAGRKVDCAGAGRSGG
jgi:polyphosphate kinase